MRNSFWIFLVFSLLPDIHTMADTIGLWAGLYAGSSDVLADDRDYFLTPALEYEQSFGNFDLHVGAEYTFSLTRFYPQFFFGEEKIAAHLPLGSLSEFLFTLHNENELRFDPDRDGNMGSGRVRPELSYAWFLPLGDISLGLGSPISYPLWGAEDSFVFGIDASAAYVAPFWLGFRAVARFIAAPDAAFDGMEFAVNYTQDQYFGELAFKAEKSLDYFSLKAEFDYFFNFLVLKAAVELGGLGDLDTLTLTPAIGIQYRF